MATNYDAIDIVYTWNGDFAPGMDGDFADTATDQIQSLVQEIMTIAHSALNDWEEQPYYAASLNDYIGEPNNKETAQKLVTRIHHALVSNNVVKASDLSIVPIPVENHRILFVVKITAMSTPNNNLTSSTGLVVNIVYDSQEQNINFVDIIQLR